MSTLFASFPKTSKADWVQLLQKELKGESLDVLQKFNKVEEIAFPAYFHREDQPKAFSDPGLSPYTRGSRSDSNDWEIGSCFRITDEKAGNASLLKALMAGTTALVLHAETEKALDFGQLFSEIGLEYIHTTFYPKTIAQAEAFVAFAGRFPSAVVLHNDAAWLASATKTRQQSVRPFAVSGYSVQQAGGTTWQEAGIALAEGHDLLVAQLEAGLSIDEAAANIHFVLGIGNKYFFEIAKFRAFRMAWARIVAEYQPANEKSQAAYITAQTGFIHTSLKDPYTNLLRQTTEGMSAIVGGVEQLVIQPYDWYATEQQTAFTQRMATNISLLLKEESYLDKVIDPAGGSYALDDLTNAVAERAWASFQWIEANGGISDTTVRSALFVEIREKAEQRLAMIRDKQATLIGINVFPNPEVLSNQWNPLPAGWNALPALNIESELQKA
jgi:methylmalonyl-CoA mutase